MINRLEKNIHKIDVPFNEWSKFLFLSDIHWDNPKCDLDLLKSHLDQAKEQNAKVLVNGDFFCLMQGKGDPRRSKDDIRPEHNSSRYLDKIIETAVEWFKPYVDTLAFIGYGNHETGIIRHQETDILARFVDLFNATYKPKQPIQLGGYGGWLVFRMEAHGRSKVFITHYFHGSGGGGPVTQNMIQHQRQRAMIEGADLIWMGHTHDSYFGHVMKHGIDRNNLNQKIQRQYFLQTPTYKEEYKNREGGFHVERGRPPKPLGGYWIELKFVRIRDKGQDYLDYELKGYHTN